MASNRQTEVYELYKKAQRILLHEMTDSERLFVDELGWADYASLSEDRLSRLRELVRAKGDTQGAT
jgi:hypothetical protein